DEGPAQVVRFQTVQRSQPSKLDRLDPLTALVGHCRLDLERHLAGRKAGIARLNRHAKLLTDLLQRLVHGFPKAADGGAVETLDLCGSCHAFLRMVEKD